VIHALHLTTWHPWIHGLAGVFVLEQCEAIRRSGVDVGMVFSRIEGWGNLSLARLPRGLPGFVRTDVPVPTWGFKSWSLPGASALAPRIVDATLRNRYAAYEIERGRPDVLHAHVALQAGPVTRRIAQAIGVPYVVTEHSSEILNGGLSAQREQQARQVYADAHCVIAVSSALATRITDICPAAKVKVIGNMVPDHIFALRDSVQMSGDDLIVLTLCNLQPSKRVVDAIEALAGLPNRLKARIVLHVIGDGPERRRLEQLALAQEFRSQFHGELPRVAAMNMLAGADLLLHPSAFETFGIVLAEAAALGVPVIATRCGGPEDIVSSDSGLLVDVGDVAALQSGIMAILDDISRWKGRREMMSRRAFDLFHESRFAQSVTHAYG
jgi:glycosyltransferase involved in cell wall biosynthesis